MFVFPKTRHFWNNFSALVKCFSLRLENIKRFEMYEPGSVILKKLLTSCSTIYFGKFSNP